MRSFKVSKERNAFKKFGNHCYKQFKAVSLRLAKKPSESGAKFIKTKSRIEKSVKDYVACELR